LEKQEKKKKRVGGLVVVLIGALLLLDALFNAVVANINSGIVVLGVFSLVLLTYGIFWFKGRIARWIHAVVIVICSIVLVFCGFLVVYGNSDNARFDEDAVIVLGAGVRGDRVSTTLAWRLDRAVEYYAANPDAVIVVTGGQGSQESVTEALAMERYLIERGVPAEKIIKEEQATSTYENFLFSDALLKQEFGGEYSAVLITNSYHVYRAERTAHYAGISSVRHMGARINWYNMPPDYMREMMAVVKLWVIEPTR